MVAQRHPRTSSGLSGIPAAESWKDGTTETEGNGRSYTATAGCRNTTGDERKRAEEERERLRQAQADLAHINRVSTMGELTASLAHEIKQPIAAATTDAKTCLRWLGRDEPDVGEAREAASRLIKDVSRASDIIGRIGSLFKKNAPNRETFATEGRSER